MNNLFSRSHNDDDGDVLVAELIEFVTVSIQKPDGRTQVHFYEVGDERIQQIEEIINGKAGNADDSRISGDTGNRPI